LKNILLYQHAKKEVGKNADEALEKAAESEWRRFVLDFDGDQAKADEALRQRQMDRESFKERQKRAILIQWYADSKLPKQRPVTYRDLLDYYNQMKDEYFAKAGMIRLRLIDIQPARVAVQDPNEDRRQLAEKQAYELLKQIEAGEDFGELAKKYSHGDWREFGGLWRPVRPESLAPPYDILGAEAEKIQPPQVAGPIVVEGHVFIMKLEEKQSAGYEPFENVQGQIEQKLILDRGNEIFDRLNARMMQQVELGETDKFIDFCLEKIYLMSNR
jgi:parvulin-like peptidyl-prolyl isomerase